MPPRSQSAPRAARPDPEPSSAGDQQYRVVVKVHAVAFEPDCPNGSFAVTLERPGGGKSVTSRNVNPAWPLLSTDKLESGWTGQAGRHVFEADVPEHTQVYSGPFQDGQRHGKPPDAPLRRPLGIRCPRPRPSLRYPSPLERVSPSVLRFARQAPTACCASAGASGA